MPYSKFKIAVVGDIMIDHRIEGDVNKVSPEAPIVILNKKEEKYALGGAANAAANVAGLGAEVVLLGVWGFYGLSILNRLCEKTTIKNKIVMDTCRKTTIKKRFVSMGQHILRVDDEDKHAIREDHEEYIIKELKKDKFDGIILSDYGKGVLTPRICQVAIKIGSPVFVDPKDDAWLKFKGCEVITPNQKEYFSPNPPIAKNIKYIVVTMGEKGAEIIGQTGIDHGFNHVVKTEPVEVFDVGGAGDTFITALTCEYLRTKQIVMAVRFANKCAGIVVSKRGTQAIDIKEVSINRPHPYNTAKRIFKSILEEDNE